MCFTPKCISNGFHWQYWQFFAWWQIDKLPSNLTNTLLDLDNLFKSGNFPKNIQQIHTLHFAYSCKNESSVNGALWKSIGKYLWSVACDGRPQRKKSNKQRNHIDCMWYIFNCHKFVSLNSYNSMFICNQKCTHIRNRNHMELDHKKNRSFQILFKWKGNRKFVNISRSLLFHKFLNRFDRGKQHTLNSDECKM